MASSVEYLYDDLVSLSWCFSNDCCSENQSSPLPMVDFMALRWIHQNHQTPIHCIGKALGMTKSGATRVVKRLEKQGFVAISTCTEDARVRCLSLTQEGSEAVERVIDSQSSQLNVLLAMMGENLSQQLAVGVKALLETMKQQQG